MNLSNLLPTIEAACGLSTLRPSGEDQREPLVLGVSDAGKAPVVAGLARAADAPTLVIVPKPPQALTLAEELAAWLGEALPILAFPERDTFPYERILPDPEALRDRLLALQALRSGQPCIVVASGVAIAQRTLPAGAPQETQVELRTGGHSSPEALLASLLRLGYRTTPLVALPGDAARRGGIVDVFPATDDAPIRIEFFGDSIETMRRFDLDSQRSGELVEAVSLGPAREVIDLPAAVATLVSGLPEGHERLEEELTRLQAGEAPAEEAFYLPFVASGSLLEHLPEGGLLIVDEPADLTQALEEHDTQTEEVRRNLEARGELPAGLPSPHATWEELRTKLDEQPGRLHLSRWAVEAATNETGDASPPLAGTSRRLPFAPADAYGGRLRDLATAAAEAAARGRALVIVSQQAQRLAEVLEEQGVPATLVDEPATPQPGVIALVAGSLPHGWRLTTSQPPLTLLTDAEVFGFVKQRRRLPRRTASALSAEAFLAELTPGDHVVHIEHGIARFAGLVQRRIDDVEREYLELHYADGDRLYLPADQVDRVSRYAGPGEHEPRLTRLGSQEWSRAKDRVRRAVAELAQELLELYATRQVAEGRALPPDTAWQQELEASFPYVETADQLAAIQAVKEDMERPRPM
ncbi:MAG: transcription-repair coupling factor, partial [Chloroflexi bacterium]|nr:transcription-repair coupling factor [Chloroflexota bacterium]